MGKLQDFMRSFQTRLTLVLVSSMFFIALASNVLVQQFSLNAQFEQMRNQLRTIASLSAMILDVDALKAVPLSREGMDTAQYKRVAFQLQQIKKANPMITYIYVMGKTTQEGMWQFLVDPDPVVKRRSGITSFPGDKYAAYRFPEMLKGELGPSADKKLEVDEWGVTLSGYAPVVDKDGRTVAVLGVDMLADDVYYAQMSVHVRTIFILLLGVIVSFILGILFSKWLAEPIKGLVIGTHRVSQGDLYHKVRVRGSTEIRELANSFNRMAEDLGEARKKNHDYFYSVIQSLVRIVEAKDSYTRGHSERVAEYAKEIALRMGFSQDSVELLRQAAVLHDVGKLAVHDSILNKTGPLTAEEWEEIRRHPITGENILKPVSLHPELLVIVRGHHERYDGKGYPDQQKGDETSMFAQILAVVDAYDAMTSSRAYRSALSQEAAIGELVKNSGTQFNPQIVEVFIKILKEKTPDYA